MSRHYYIIRWGRQMRRPPRKFETPVEAAKEAYGTASPSMEYKDVGSRKHLSAEQHHEAYGDEGWTPIPVRVMGVLA